jgi:hypothetical protein
LVLAVLLLAKWGAAEAQVLSFKVQWAVAAVHLPTTAPLLVATVALVAVAVASEVVAMG